MIKIHPVIVIVALLIMVACAQTSAPQGGPMDETPPELILVTPPNLLLHFEASGFEMLFDEYIQIDDLDGQLIISPPLNKKPEYKLRGKKLTIWWDEKLKENRTYQFNLGDAVKDFKEGNINNELVYVFSTGDYIDSLSITGKVYDVLTNEPVKGAKVMLYKNHNDTLPYTTRPDYLAVTDFEGKFAARYLPPDTFLLFVLEESNSNFKYDGAPERIGFLDYYILASYQDTVLSHVVALFEEPDTSQYIKSNKGKDYGFHEIVFNLPVAVPEVYFFYDFEAEPLRSINILSQAGDSIKSWVSLTDFPELEEIYVVINDGMEYIDTLEWYVEIDPKYREKPKLQISASEGKLDQNKPFVLSFNYPLLKADSSLLQLFEDSVRIYPSEVKLTNFDRRLEVYHPFGRNKSYELTALAGAFQDLYGSFSDSLNFKFGLNPDDFYGSLSARIMLEDSIEQGHFLVFLENSKGMVVDTTAMKYSQDINYGKLAPGKYKLRGLFDLNDDRKWTPGNFKAGLQPERKAFFLEDIDVRSNWELDVDWFPSTPFD